MYSFENFSEDSFLSGMMTASYVIGVQKGGIGTAIKHFVYAIQPQLCHIILIRSFFNSSANDKLQQCPERQGSSRNLSHAFYVGPEACSTLVLYDGVSLRAFRLSNLITYPQLQSRQRNPRF